MDRTGLVATLQVTQLCGLVSLLYGALLRHHSPAQRCSTPPPPLDQVTLTLAAEALSALLQLAQLDLHMFQVGQRPPAGLSALAPREAWRRADGEKCTGDSRGVLLDRVFLMGELMLPGEIKVIPDKTLLLTYVCFYEPKTNDLYLCIIYYVCG